MIPNTYEARREGKLDVYFFVNSEIKFDININFDSN